MKKIIIPSKRIGNEALKNWVVKDSTDEFNWDKEIRKEIH